MGSLAIKGWLLWLIGRWQRLGLSTRLLVIVEPGAYLVGLSLFSFGWVYFLSLACVGLGGAWMGLRERSDAGRTIWQLYLIDATVQVFGALHYLARYYWWIDFPEWAGDNGADLYSALSVGLGLARVLAILGAVTIPGQAGWPNLIPGFKHVRDIPGTVVGDRFVYLALVGCLGYGFWIQTQEPFLRVGVWVVPALLALLVDVGRLKGISPVQGLSSRTVQLAAVYESMSNEQKDLVDRMIDATNDSWREHGDKVQNKDKT